jgi:LytS/YehU family sensor histidine kinase
MEGTNFESMIISLIGTIAVIDLVAIILASAHKAAKITEKQFAWLRVLTLGILGGLFGIYATISGYTMPSGAVVSIRDVGALMAGCVGGPLAGLLAGTIAGLHRLLIGFRM